MSAIPPWILRRAWVLVVTITLVVVIGSALNTSRSESYYGEATFLVPSGADADGPGSAFEAKSLAVTYVSLIPKDEAVLRYVARRAELPIDEVRGRLQVSTVADTSLVRVQFSSPALTATRQAMDALVQSLTGRVPTSAAIPPGTLVLTNSEVDPDARSTQARSAALLALLGIGLGAVLVAAMERVDARDDEAGQLVGFTDASIVDMAQISPSVARSLFMRRYESMGAPDKVVVAPITRHYRASSRWVVRQLRDGARGTEIDTLERLSLGPSPRPGDPDMIQLAEHPVALVVGAGVPAAAVRDTFETLSKAEASVRWIFFTPRSAARKLKASPHAKPEAKSEAAVSA